MDTVGKYEGAIREYIQNQYGQAHTIQQKAVQHNGNAPILGGGGYGKNRTALFRRHSNSLYSDLTVCKVFRQGSVPMGS